MFSRNIGTLSNEEQLELQTKRVLIAGCGGLGGYIAEYCVRLGIHNIVIADYDKFVISNINRQRFSNTKNLKKSKVMEAYKALKEINPKATFKVVDAKITKDNIDNIAARCDLIFDALDNVEGRKILQACGEKLGIPIVSAGVDGLVGQVTTCYPMDKSITKLFKNKKSSSASVLVTTVANMASFAVNEGMNVLLGSSCLRKKVLLVNLKTLEFEIIPL